jgi:hypothetical protein
MISSPGDCHNSLERPPTEKHSSKSLLLCGKCPGDNTGVIPKLFLAPKGGAHYHEEFDCYLCPECVDVYDDD